MAPNSRVYFVDGHSSGTNVICIASYMYALENTDVELTRIYLVANNKWEYYDISSHIVSLTYTADPARWWLLGKRGDITVLTPQEESTEFIQDAGTGPGKFGYLDKIVQIEGELYACGYRRQVYKRCGGAWRHMDAGILCGQEAFALGLTSLDGTDANNIYAAGRRGEVFHFNGERWARSDSPSTLTLRSVKCVEQDKIYICGNNGIVLEGNKNLWHVIKEDGFDDHFWSIEMFKDEIYMTSRRGIMRLVKDGYVSVDMDRPTDGYRLHATRDQLWSIGTNEILVFDGKRWEVLVCPDNVVGID